MSSTLSENQPQWYIRRGEVVRGPFPKEKITDYLLRGRIKEGDELSLDQEQWQLATEHPQLSSLLFEEGDDALLRQQLMAKKQWEAQRTVLGNESRYQQSRPETYDDLAERKSLSALDSTSSAATDVTRLQQRKSTSRVLAGFVLFSLLSVMIVMIYLNQPEPDTAAIDCTTAAAPKVNWSNCQMEAAVLPNANLIGAAMQNMNLMRADLRGSQLVDVNLSFSNLSASLLGDADIRQAMLVGVSLRGADLTGVVFDGADLSYADLGNAEISNTSFLGVKLDKAKWVDGRICAVGSVGSCQ